MQDEGTADSTTLPSPVDRGEFRFVAVDVAGVEWLWVDDELVWKRLGEGKARDDVEGGECDVLR